MRLLTRPLVLAAAACLGACTSSTEIRPDQDALAAAAQFESLADDGFRAGADVDVWNAYRNVALLLGRNGRISPVTVVIDGTPLDFLATAQQVEADGGPACAAPGSLCLLTPPLRSVVAWQKSNPRRVVQLTATAGSATIAAIFGPPSGDFLNVATLTYFDGEGGTFVGTSGTQTIGEPVTSDTPCYTTRIPDGAVSVPELARCTRAEFIGSFEGTVAPPPFVVRGNTASGTHTIAMASQPVHGARLQLAGFLLECPGCGGYPPPFQPPVALSGGALRAIVSAAVAGTAVTFELRVTNPQAQPVTLQFSSGQQYDFRVRRPDGSTAWVWSADKGFTQALTSRTLAPNETATYTETWSPAAKGSFVAEGWLTSTSHRAAGSVAVSVP
jgi:hypothetical protein